MTTVALDAMGGDYGVNAVVPAAISALTKNKRLKIVLVGDENSISDVLRVHDSRKSSRLGSRLSIVHTDQHIHMDDTVSMALRSKRNSSMHKSVELVRDKTATACVSAGNTGALMAVSRLKLRTLEGIDRPAIISPLPTKKGHSYMLDLGANVGSNSEQLVQFAIMGSVLSKAIDGLQAPRIGLLNIGSEEIKGNDVIRQAARLLSDTHLNYTGFVEGDTLFEGNHDVVVCDGFVGNVALKCTEGAAKLMGYYAREEFNRNWATKLVGVFAKPVFRNLKQQFDPKEYNGAILIGLPGIVVKSHGSADMYAFEKAIEVAFETAKNDIHAKISDYLSLNLEEFSP